MTAALHRRADPALPAQALRERAARPPLWAGSGCVGGGAAQRRTGWVGVDLPDVFKSVPLAGFASSCAFYPAVPASLGALIAP